jgi:hypothetical protein
MLGFLGINHFSAQTANLQGRLIAGTLLLGYVAMKEP